MFKNPLKFQQGGVTSSQENEVVRIFSAAATKLQMKPEALLQKAQELQGDQQTAFIRAIQDIAESDNPKQESIQMIQSVFGKEPQSFKTGGKIRSFICRFGHGGITDCGCGGSIQKGQAGLVVDTNGSVIPAFADSSVVRSGNWSLQPLFIEDGVLKTYAYGPNGQVLQIVNDGQNVRYLGGRVSDVDGSRRFVQSGDFIGVEDASQVDSPEKYILPSNLVNTYRRMVKNDNTGFLKMREPVRTVELVPKNQVGGQVEKHQQENGVGSGTIASPLSRAAAYELSRQNKGYTNEGMFNYAVRNAERALRAQGLRGAALRDASYRMASGYEEPELPEIDTNVIIEETPIEMPASTANLSRGEIKPISLKPASPVNDNMTFNQAFRAAANAGLKEFTWKGNPYKVAFDPNWRNKRGGTSSAGSGTTPSRAASSGTTGTVGSTTRNRPIEAPVNYTPVEEAPNYSVPEGYTFRYDGNSSTSRESVPWEGGRLWRISSRYGDRNDVGFASQRNGVWTPLTSRRQSSASSQPEYTQHGNYDFDTMQRMWNEMIGR